MLKNIFFPLLLIIITTLGTVYFWFDGLPSSLFGIIGFLTLGIGSMYISYYTFYAIFPDEKNKPMPPVQDLIYEYQKQKGKPHTITKGSFWGTIMAIVITAGGVYFWTKLAGKYKTYELEKYGKETTATIVDVGYQKGIGTYRKYKYYNNDGKVFTDKFSNKTFTIGDTITILYSTNRPVINKIIRWHDEE